MFAGCCPATRVPATMEADLARQQRQIEQLTGENEYLKGKFSELSSATEGYAGSVAQIATDADTDIAGIRNNQEWLGNFIQRILTELPEQDNQPETQPLVGQN